MVPIEDRSARTRYVVLGFPRSGTSLLGRLLSSHPDVSCPPETNILSACGRFLREESDVEGPPIGVIPGLGFSGVPEEYVYGSLRELFFGAHAAIADGKPVWVEKTAFDVFYVEEIERLLSGHCRFISISRHPLDVVASVKELFDATGTIFPEAHEYVRQIPSLHEAYAQAWADCNRSVQAFRARDADNFAHVRYEDLVEDPARTMAGLAEFMGIAPFPENFEQNAFDGNARVGLGDWRIYESKGVDKSRKDRWREKVLPSTAARVLDRVGPVMEALGYERPSLPKQVRAEDKLRRYTMAKTMQQSVAAGEGAP